MTEDIKKPQTGIMTDYEGNPSSMRWMSVGCVFIAVAFGCWTLYQGKEAPGLNLVSPHWRRRPRRSSPRR